jgi:isochorismate synthase
MLIYRFPGKEVNRLSGDFERIADVSEIKEGFIVGSFADNQYYVFKEIDDTTAPTWHLGVQPEETSKEMYVRTAKKAIQQLQSGQLTKVVLSRIKCIEFSIEQRFSAFLEMEKAYPNALVYLFSSAELGTWIGASPEVFLSRNGASFKMASLAGTRTSDEKSTWREKEVEEQQFVTDYILEGLDKLNATAIEINGPHVITAGPVQHLQTEICGSSTSDTGAFIRELHPTPAVAGLPKKESIQFIRNEEKHNRRMYTGIIGYVSEATSTIYVNLRCAQLTAEHAFLYVGGGFTALSDVEEEWNETENKAMTMERILQFN